MEEGWDEGDPDVEPDVEPDGLDELDVFGSPGGSAEEARQAGDDGVAGLDKVTAQMAGGEHRPEQQEMCRAVAEALVTGTHLVVQAGTGTGKSLAYLIPRRTQRQEGGGRHGDQCPCREPSRRSVAHEPFPSQPNCPRVGVDSDHSGLTVRSSSPMTFSR